MAPRKKNLEFPEAVVETPVVEEEVKEIKIVEVTGCERLRLRAKPNTNSDVITELEAGSKLKVENEVKDFYKVQTMDGTNGYVMKQYTK